MAEHLQAELTIRGDADRMRRGRDSEAGDALDLEFALQGDCLTAFWARRAERRFGRVEQGVWSTLIVELRDRSPAAATALRLDADESIEREAFARGYAGGDLHDCFAPGFSGVFD